jgi:hypothetical protein
MEVYLLAYIILALYVSGRIHSSVALKPAVPTGWVQGQSGHFGKEIEASV